jgi:hypothetical protein
VRQYFIVLDKLRTTASTPLTRIRSVATSAQLASETKLVRDERERHLHQVGATRIADLKVQAVDLSHKAAQAVPTVTIDVCWDVSNADLVDATGKSVVNPHRPERGWTRYTVANYHWSSNPSGSWRIASSQDLKQTPCAG